MSRIVDLVDAVHQHQLGKSNGNGVPTGSAEQGTTTPKTASSSANVSPRLQTQDLSQGAQRITHFRTPPTTPSMRTGPPHSLSYSYSSPNTPVASRSNSKHDHGDASQEATEHGEFPFTDRESAFRDALEARAVSDTHRGKKRESKLPDESWNPLKWFHESPKEEKEGFNFDSDLPSAPRSTDHAHADTESVSRLPPSGLRRTSSVPASSSDRKSGVAKWGRLRAFIPNITQQSSRSPVTPGQSAVTGHNVNITDELITGGLSTLMLRLWFERDDNDQRRIPVLFHRLRIRVSDSLHPLHGHKSVFRIECEYANGAARWVIYRELKDFLSLHYHYSLSNVYRRNVENMPEFPKTSLPYFKFLQREGNEKGKQVGRSEFARMQREALENYLLDLIRAVMFHPSTNRLAGFLEISALSIYLSQSGGAQYKAGYLRIEAADKRGGGFGRKGLGWKVKREARWCAVRESYLVVLVEPGELEIWDVFLLDSDFKIERPRRYYRSLLHPDSIHHEHEDNASAIGMPSYEADRRSLIGSIKGTFSRVLRLSHCSDGGESRPNGLPSMPRPSSAGSSSSTSVSSRAPTPMLDPSTNANPLAGEDDNPEEREAAALKREGRGDKDVSKHTFYISNTQMRLRVVAKNQRQMLQWITALEKVASSSHYTGGNRFDSFSPIRLNVAAQWLVDGRDYFWNLSRAILLAKETIYIHDWWLSPELQLRRPNKDRYRMDNLLERKAKEGVKIFIIVYKEVSNRTTPTDSNYTKQRMMSLHPNIMVQRSPSHFQTGTFYWAHHEKLCVIDQAIAFMGGLDLCFGRWDTPQHVIVDDDENEIWPGKDYSNARVLDFHTLDKPTEDMYDRTKVPRMPWHDVGMQVVGQPARDLARHFVQRWNYLLRIKNHSRTMPFLIPPPDFRPGELNQMGLTGTCEMQICRSAGPWSLGTPDRIEHSIQNAYLKAIQMSEHFVYIENQFFITSTVVNDVKVENKIGDALVHRILRAHRDGTPWKCCIVIPLLPGFAFPVDHSEASSIRIILECQNRTIGRGPNSIFSRLRKEGIDPDDYISVFSLRNWGKLRGVLTTEQVYIHGKVCIVDDRLAIIGSANINERSQRGDRDSELAAVIRDTDMIDSTMAGKAFKVGRFAHTLRVRLMREHAGIDVDNLHEDELMGNVPAQSADMQEAWDPDVEQRQGAPTVTRVSQTSPMGGFARMGLDGIGAVLSGSQSAAVKTASHMIHRDQIKDNNPDHADNDGLEEERNTYTREGKKVPGFADSVVPTLEEKTVHEQHVDDLEKEANQNGDRQGARTANGDLYGAPADASASTQMDNEAPLAKSGVEDANEEESAAPRARNTLRRHLTSKLGSKAWAIPTSKPQFDADSFEDPVADSFWKDIWVACAVHNTEIYRKVFHTIPDDLVTTWKQYKEFIVHHERLNKHPRDSETPEAVGRVPSEAGDEKAPNEEQYPEKELVNGNGPGEASDEATHPPEGSVTDGDATSSIPGLEKEPSRTRSRSARGTEPFSKAERDEMERLLGELSGHLVLYPTRFLNGEDVSNNFLFNADRLLPMPIYN